MHKSFKHIPVTSTSFPGSILPELGRTQYLYLCQRMYLGGKGLEGVLLWRSCLDFEGHRSMVGIANSKDLGDFSSEGSCNSLAIMKLVTSWHLPLGLDHSIAIAQAVAGAGSERDQRWSGKLLRWKPSSAGSISTDMMMVVKIGDGPGALLCNDVALKLPDLDQCQTIND